jgi:hypothetical protein
MPNGKIGDHPYTDIVHHGLDTYSPVAAAFLLGAAEAVHG